MNAFQKHLDAIRSGRVTRTNIIGLRKAFNTFERMRSGYSTARTAPNVTAGEILEASQAIRQFRPVATGELHDGGVKVLRNPRYAKRWNDRQRAIINYPGIRFRLVRFDWLDAVHCVPVFKAIGDERMGSFTFRNVPWQTAWTKQIEDGPRVVRDFQS